ncbi:hypothetical protein [Embleya sp. NPDC005575]|uniref:hypothetical protein n=1 Tax=Embleya sp. NPDC005575 TaxID=3156892 RepID=UPI0033AB1B4C
MNMSEVPHLTVLLLILVRAVVALVANVRSADRHSGRPAPSDRARGADRADGSDGSEPAGEDVVRPDADDATTEPVRRRRRTADATLDVLAPLADLLQLMVRR